MFRRGWEAVDATLVTQKVVERVRCDATNAGATYHVREYVVELAGHDGQPVQPVQPVQPTIKEKAFKLELPELDDAVPLLVNRQQTKAAFDLDDPRIDAEAARRAEEAADEARADARFAAANQGGAELAKHARAQATEAEALAVIEGGGDDLDTLAAMGGFLPPLVLGIVKDATGEVTLASVLSRRLRLDVRRPGELAGRAGG